MILAIIAAIVVFLGHVAEYIAYLEDQGHG